jgi:hypothetical protein
MPDEYARFRNSTGCGHKTGTAQTGPSVCGRPPKFTVRPGLPTVVNGLVCGIYRRAVERWHNWPTEPITRQAP